MSEGHGAFRALRFDHVGIAVRNVDSALTFYAGVLGYRVRAGPFDDATQQARVVFLAGGPDEPFAIELVAPLGDESHVHRLLERSAGAYHLCYETPDLRTAIQRLVAAGCLLVRPPAPATAYAGRSIAWLYTPVKQLMELVEAGPSPR